MPTINRKKIGSGCKKKSSTDSYKEWSSYYNNKMWLGERDYYLRRHPICECCYVHGRINGADAVHHKIPFGRGIDEEHKIQLLINPGNFMSVCKTCHKALHIKDSICYQEILDTLTDKEYEDAHGLKWLK